MDMTSPFYAQIAGVTDFDISNLDDIVESDQLRLHVDPVQEFDSKRQYKDCDFKTFYVCSWIFTILGVLNDFLYGCEKFCLLKAGAFKSYYN